MNLLWQILDVRPALVPEALRYYAEIEYALYRQSSRSSTEYFKAKCAMQRSPEKYDCTSSTWSPSSLASLYEGSGDEEVTTEISSSSDEEREEQDSDQPHRSAARARYFSSHRPRGPSGVSGSDSGGSGEDPAAVSVQKKTDGKPQISVEQSLSSRVESICNRNNLNDFEGFVGGMDGNRGPSGVQQRSLGKSQVNLCQLSWFIGEVREEGQVSLGNSTTFWAQKTNDAIRFPVSDGRTRRGYLGKRDEISGGNVGEEVRGMAGTSHMQMWEKFSSEEVTPELGFAKVRGDSKMVEVEGEMRRTRLGVPEFEPGTELWLIEAGANSEVVQVEEMRRGRTGKEIGGGPTGLQEELISPEDDLALDIEEVVVGQHLADVEEEQDVDILNDAVEEDAYVVYPKEEEPSGTFAVTVPGDQGAPTVLPFRTITRIHLGQLPMFASLEPCLGGRILQLSDTGASASLPAYPTYRRPRHSCPTCGMPFTLRESLKKHVKAHIHKKRCACYICGQRLSRSSSLARHMKIHTRKKPFLCGECGKGFSDSRAWNGHMRIHSRSKDPHVRQRGSTGS